MRHAWFLCAGLILLVSPAGRGVPVISPSGSDVVVSEGDRLELMCRDEDDDSPALQWVRRKGRRVEAELEMGGASVIRITTVQQQHMGQYTCQNTHTNQTTSIYVYVKDPQNAFVRSMVSEVLVREGDDGTLSCLVTDPAVSHVTLQSCDGSALPVDLRFASHPHTGVTISNVSTHFQGCYVCVGQRERARVSSIQYNLIVRPVPESAPVIHLSSENTVFLIQNQQLHLSCSSININHDLQLNWSLPPAAVALESRSTYILPGHQGYERFVKLNIRSVKMSDSGVYRCSAKNERGVSMATVNLEVYEQGFINMTETDGRVLEVTEGDSLTLRALMTSHPPPSSLTWSYNNQQLHNTSEHLITLHTHHYRFVSALRLVRVQSSEGGVYTLSANHSDASANLSFTVHVICKPLIVSQEGPVDGLVRCVASGCPVPEISWYYCKTPSTRCSQLLNSTRAAEDEVSLVKVSEFRFGRSEVESRLKVHGGRFHALECVASTRGEQAYTLFSISDRPLQHQLFTPLFSSVVCTSVLLVLLLLLLLYKYLQKPKFQIHWKVIDSFDGNNYIYIDPSQLPYDPRWEFPRERLRFGRTLGAGAFGRVVSATAYGLSSPDTVTTVAVKMLKPSAHSTEKEALMSELKVLSYIGHHINIVNLLGACTVSGPTLVITEYCCYGDLLNYMRRKRQEFNSSETGDGYYKNMLSQNQPSSEENDNGYVPMTSYQKRSSQTEWSDEKDDLSLNTEDLLSFSYQVARGMDFLSSKHCVHRDLAARNILLTQGRLAKICDFGLARDITTDSSYVLRGNARLPVKWMSPESLFTCVYSYESDVWSYGILLWEIFSLGNTPYPGIPVGSRFYKMIQDGYRMSEPEFAPCEVYEVMRWCWSSDPLKRPTFQKLVERTELLLSETTRHEYLNLSGISEATLPPGQQRAERLSSTASTRPLLRTTSRSLLEPSSV